MTLPEWSEVLASALVGTARRPVHRGLSTADEPALALLDTAAVLTVYRRAGVPPTTGLPSAAPAPAESTPAVGEAAASRLAALVEPGAPGLDAELRGELLVEWLTRAAAAGRRCPAELLPALLDAGRRERRLRPLVGAVGGARAGWLAAQRSEWRYLTGERDGSAAAAPDTWRFGTPGQRAGYLSALRATDPTAARELLADGWAGESPDERAALLDTLRTGLGPADEEFLEAALADRRKEVRAVAGELLGRLTGSAYRARMVARARACVRHEAGRLVVRPPEECDAAMRRDGIVPKPPQGLGERAWWLEQVVARTPLDTWTAGDPAAFLALPVADDWGPVLLRGVARAAVTARDPQWAVAVFDRLPTVGDRRASDGELLNAVIATVPDDRLADRVVILLRADPSGGQGLDGLLARCPRPWPPALVDGVLSTLALPVERLGSQWRVSTLCRLAATRLPVDTAGRVDALAGTVRARARELAAELDATGGRPDAAIRARLSGTESLARDLGLTAEVLRYRHDLIEELS